MNEQVVNLEQRRADMANPYPAEIRPIIENFRTTEADFTSRVHALDVRSLREITPLLGRTELAFIHDVEGMKRIARVRAELVAVKAQCTSSYAAVKELHRLILAGMEKNRPSAREVAIFKFKNGEAESVMHSAGEAVVQYTAALNAALAELRTMRPSNDN